MKKLLIMLLAASLGSMAFAQFPDVPSGHWAEDAVERIADLNIVIGFPDGTFRGSEAFTRYQASLVVSRLLNIIEADMATMGARLSAVEAATSDIASLEADVAAQGVAVDAAQASADGAQASADAAMGAADAAQGTADGAQASADAAMGAADGAQATADGAQASADAAMGAADAAQATADGAQASADAAQGTADAAQASADGAQASADANASDIASLETDVAAQGVAIDAAQSVADANAAEIAALNQLMQLLGDEIDSVEAASNEGFAAVDASLADLEGDIVNIREFAILLRRDQVAVRNRVADLEGRADALEGRVDALEAADLDARVTALETNPLGFNGSIELSYYETAFGGIDASFDVDRAYGVGMNVSMAASAFSSGADGDAVTANDEVDEPGEYAEDRADFSSDDSVADAYFGSDFDASITVALGDDLSFGGEGAPRGLNSFSAVATFELDEISGAPDQYAFGLDSWSSTFEAIGAGPITVDFGEEVSTTFTPYFLVVEDVVGLVANIGAPDMLAFLDPALQVVYLTTDQDEAALTTATTAIRGTLSPLEGLTGSFSVGADVSNLDDLDTALEFDGAFGLDGAGTFSLAGLELSLAGEYARTFDSDAATTEIDVLFIEGSVDVADLLGGVTVGANYRDIDGAWVSGDVDEYQYAVNQTGFGLDVTADLMLVTVGAFYDAYTFGGTDNWAALGVDAAADLFAGFSISGDFAYVTANGTVADDDSAGIDEYATGYGVILSHDGSADDALIANLNIDLSFDADTVDFNVTTLAASADYEATISIVTLTPYVSYELLTDGDDSTNNGTDLMVGTGIVTEPLDILFSPSLEAAVNYRNKAFTDAAVDYVGTQLQWSVGLNLGEFLLPNTTLAARYGYYAGTNWTVDNVSAGPSDRGDLTNTVSGFEVQVDFYDLIFDYGLYTYDPDTATASDETRGQAFGVAYQVNF